MDISCFRSGQFTPFVPLLPLPQTESGVLGGGHSPLNPLCPSPKTGKFCFAFNNKSYLGNLK